MAKHSFNTMDLVYVVGMLQALDSHVEIPEFFGNVGASTFRDFTEALEALTHDLKQKEFVGTLVSLSYEQATEDMEALRKAIAETEDLKQEETEENNFWETQKCLCPIWTKT